MPHVVMSEQEAGEFLHQQRIGYLATVTPEGSPYITPLNYLYTDGKLYFHSGRKGRKLDNIAAHSQVCFAVSQVDKTVFSTTACSCSTRYTSVLVFGKARVVEDSAQKAELLNAFTAKYAAGRAFTPVDAAASASCTVVEIVIISISGKRNIDPA